ncbi:amidohydrolase family protein [Streptomyces sp. NPDC051018]|uniref:amidohydrolase family protein n=1 Tax=Streptomyces sp. NPDC051018 TaxID=3365639 RepID=UPI0037A7F981
MCIDPNTPPPSPRVTRRGIMAGAAALAGATALAGAATGTAAAHDGGDRGAPGRGSSRPPRGGTMIIDGGTLLDPRTGRVTEDAVVVIEDGTVRSAGTRKETRADVAAVGKAAKVVRSDGRWVLPGLVDAHIHLSNLTDAHRAVRLGATSVRSGTTAFYQDIALRELARWTPQRVPRIRAAGIFVTPRLGDTILADPDLAPLSLLKDGVRTPEALRRVVEVNLSRGVDVIKTRVNERAGSPTENPLTQVYDREQLSATVAAARRGGATVLCHSYSEKGIHDAVTAGVDSIEHGVYLGERTMVEMRRRGTYFTPTLAAMASLAADPDPILAERGRTFLPIAQRAVRRAHEAGVRIAAGTDSSSGAVDPIGKEIELMRAAGLSALDAIRTATTNAARLIGLEGTAGRLARGYRGDAVLVDGDPLRDVSVLSSPSAVVGYGFTVDA